MEVFQPTNFRRSLFPHQLKNISIMEVLEREKRIKIDNYNYIDTRLGVLADKTGYGKTASVIGLLIRDKMEWELSTKFENETLSQFSKNNLVIAKKRSFHTRINCNIVLVPDSIAFQWEEELAYSDLKYLIVNQPQRLKRTIDGMEVIVITPKFFNLFLVKYRNVAWKRFIFDEPGNIKVPSMNEVIAGFYWFITATLGKIHQTHNKCATSFMHTFLSGYEYEWWLLNKLTIKNTDELLEISFNSPPIHHKEYYTINKTFSVVKKYASEMVTQMISAGNITGALEALGGKPTDNLFDLLKITKENKILLLKDKIEKCSLEKQQKTIKKYKAEIEKIEKQIIEIQSYYEQILGSDCLICYEQLKNPVMEPVCEALFCGACLLTWLKVRSTCPHCRSEIDTGKLYYVETEKEEKNVNILKDKLDILFEILESKPEGRFIIFSSYDQSFKNIVSAFQNKYIPFVQAKGPSKTIENNLKRFKAGEVKILLLNSNYNGAGINLQETTDVVLYHKMDSNTEIQVIGRANRIGRTEPLTVHHLLYK
jgi:SNF2 family DNA or RNA helicase